MHYGVKLSISCINLTLITRKLRVCARKWISKREFIQYSQDEGTYTKKEIFCSYAFCIVWCRYCNQNKQDVIYCSFIKILGTIRTLNCYPTMWNNNYLAQEFVEPNNLFTIDYNQLNSAVSCSAKINIQFHQTMTD